MEYKHESVLLEESIDSLGIKPDGVYVDGTAGGGGHSALIAEKLTRGGRLIAVDRDPDAIEAASHRLSKYSGRVTVIQSTFSNICGILKQQGIGGADGILLDLGVSSYQFDSPQRGFSYNVDAPLDMRMSKSGETAADLLNRLSYGQLCRTISKYGEERFASKIASAVVERRGKKPIETTFELVDVIKSAIPAPARRHGPHPARKTFQALRIAVNGELRELSDFLDGALQCLKPGGRLAIITFQSLEDRMVKHSFIDWAKGCICPPDIPVCVCGHKPEVKILYKKGIVPKPDEIEKNPRSRSARLRAVEKLPVSTEM